MHIHLSIQTFLKSFWQFVGLLMVAILYEILTKFEGYDEMIWNIDSVSNAKFNLGDFLR